MEPSRVESEVRSVEEIGTVAIVGAGTMGQGIAQVFAANGFAVVLVDRDDVALKSAGANIRDGLHRWVGKGILQPADLDGIVNRVAAT